MIAVSTVQVCNHVQVPRLVASRNAHIHSTQLATRAPTLSYTVATNCVQVATSTSVMSDAAAAH